MSLPELTLPEPVPFPSPISFPAPLSPVDVGNNPYGGSNFVYGQGLESAFQQNTQRILQTRAIQQARLQSAAQFAAVNAQTGGVLDSDPNEWTPEEAAQQTDRALAKLSTANPELAEHLAAQRSGTDTGGGFLSGLTSALGDVLHGGFSFFGKAMELIARTSHIVPNLVFDAVDGGEFNLGHDIGGAMTGEMAHNWNGVMQELGWEGNGVGGFGRALFGGALDVLSDPLTYIIPAGAGVKAEEAALQGAKVIATTDAKVVSKFSSLEHLLSASDEEVAAHIGAVWDGAMKGAGADALRAGGKALPEQAAATAMTAYTAEELAARQYMFEYGDKVHALMRTRSFKRAAEIKMSDGTTVALKDSKSILEQAVKDGNWSLQQNGTPFGLGTSSQWKAGRQFAAIAGGTRLKIAIPFTSFRYISPAMRFGPIGRVMADRGFNVFARFMAGQSGISHLMSLIGSGAIDAEEGWKAAKYWMEFGWDGIAKKEIPGFAEAFPEVAKLVRGRGKNLASMYYAMSERVGGLTAKFDSGAAASRAGLVGKYAHESQIEANAAANSFVRELKTRALGEDADFPRDYEAVFGKNITPERYLEMYDYLSYFPDGIGLDTNNPAAIEAWFNQAWGLDDYTMKVAKGGTLSPTELEEQARLTGILAHMQETAKKFNDTEKGVLHRTRSVFTTGGDEAAKADLPIGNVTMKFDEAVGIPTRQAPEWRRGLGQNDPLVTAPDDEVWFLPAEDLDGRNYVSTKNSGVGAHSKTATEDGHGVHLLSKRTSPRDQEVVIRGRQLVRLDKDRNALVPNMAHAANPATHSIEDERAVIAEVLDSAEAAVAATQHVSNVTPVMLSAEERARREAEMLTESLSHAYPDGAGTVMTLPDGTLEATMWDESNVLLAGDFADLTPYQGYAPRYLNGESMRWLRGVYDKDATQILLTEPQIRAEIERKTAGMTLREAEAQARAVIRDHLPKNVDFDSLPKFILETDPIKAQGLYVERLAQDIRARFMGRAADRQVRVGRMAPFMFNGVPRGEEFEWTIGRGFTAALKRTDRDFQDSVLKVVKKATAYGEMNHKQIEALGEDLGHLLVTLDDRVAAKLPPPDREVEAILRHGSRLAESRARIEKLVQATQDRLAALDDDDANFSLMVADVIQTALTGVEKGDDVTWITDAIGKRWAVPTDSIGAGHLTWGDVGSEGDSFYHVARPNVEPDDAVVVYHGSRRGIDGAPRGEGTGIAGYGMYVTTEKETADYYAMNEYMSQAVRHANDIPGRAPAGASTTIGALRIPKDAMFEMEAHINMDQITKLRKGLSSIDNEEARNKIASMLDRFEAEIKRNGENEVQHEWESASSLYWEATSALGSDQAASKFFLDSGYQGSHFGIERFRAKLGSDGHYYPNGATGSADAFILFDPDNSLVTMANLDQVQAKTIGPADVRDALMDKVEKGDVYRNTATGKVTTKAGNLVQKGGGRQVAPQWIRDLEREQLGRDLVEVEEARAAMDSGVRMQAAKEEGEAAAVAEPSLIDQMRQNNPQAADLIDSIGRGEGEPATAIEPTTVEVATSEAAMVKKAKTPVERVQASVEKALKSRAEGGRFHAASIKKAQRLQDRLTKSRIVMDNAMNEYNKALTEARGIAAELKPALVKVPTDGELGLLSRLRVPGLEDHAMPPYIAEEFHAAIDKHGPKGLQEEWRRFVLGPWKRWATYRWPGFHIRNTFGAWFNNFLGGVGVPEYAFSHKVNADKFRDLPVDLRQFDNYHLGKVFGSDVRGTLTYGDINDHLSRLGVTGVSAQVVSDIGNSATLMKQSIRELQSNPTKARAALRKLDGKMKDLGETVENFHRVAAWTTGMQATLGDSYGARAFTMMRHGDYADLTTVEDHVRDVIPFYKWLRTNTPYQIRMLAENPAQMMLVADKLKSVAFDVAGYDRKASELSEPEWMKEDLAIPIPSWVPFIGSKGPDEVNYAMFNMPYSDLHRGLTDYLSQALPVFRNVIESYGVGKQAFTGADLDGTKVKLSGMFNLPGIRDLLGATPWVDKGPDGGLYIDDRIENVLTAWPIYSRFRNFAEADPARVEARVGGILSTIGGFNIRAADFTAAELDFYYNEVEPHLQELRDMGVTFPDTQDFVRASGAIIPPGSPVTVPETDNGTIYQAA